MSTDFIIKGSSIFIAYMGCMGWGSAYFYGWGVSYYYGFPWWYVGVGPDNIARSLFYAVSLMTVFFISWGVGLLLFFIVKQKAKINNLGFLRLFFAMVLLFVPFVIEFSVLHEVFLWEMGGGFLITAFLTTLVIRLYSKWMPIRFVHQLKWVRQHYMFLVVSGFIFYFWAFSFLVGFYKPQIKKEYEMIQYDGVWYYVLARNHDGFILSKSFMKNNNRFIIFRPQSGESYEINLVKVRI
ncbi:TPA: hypothetical protein ACS50C_005033 [Salmonella enterica]